LENKCIFGTSHQNFPFLFSSFMYMSHICDTSWICHLHVLQCETQTQIWF